MSVETLSTKNEFEQKLSYETERKFLPIFPEDFAELREAARPIEQFYLSHPDEPFSLRMRETLNDSGDLVYEATLKDDGTLTMEGITRIEVTTPITPEMYVMYRDDTVPLLRKLRAEPVPGVVVDFYDDGTMQVESESPVNWPLFTDQHGDRLVDITTHPSSRNEWKAHLNFRRGHNGKEALAIKPEVTASDILEDIMEHFGHGPITVHLGGRSGSGKTTIVRELSDRLTRIGITTAVMSTDDYHRGTRWLTHYNNGQPWQRWDEPIVYDTETMAADITMLRAGQQIARRSIDWITVEPTYSEPITPADVLIIEGIYANATEITYPGDLTYELTTPLATCVGRRLLRDMLERPQFADPAASLFYMLEQAEPAYRQQLLHRGIPQ